MHMLLVQGFHGLPVSPTGAAASSLPEGFLQHRGSLFHPTQSRSQGKVTLYVKPLPQ